MRDAEKGRLALVQKTKQEEAAHVINREYEQFVKNITYEYQQQTREIEYQLTLRKMEIAEKQGADTWKNKMQRLEVEEQYQDGKIGKHERKYRLLLLDQELERITERARIQTAHEEDVALADKQGDAEGKRNTALGEASRLQNVKMSLPTVEEMAGIFKVQSEAQRKVQLLYKRIEEVGKKISSVKEAIRGIPDFLPTPGKMVKEMEELEKEKSKYLESRKRAQNLLNNSVSRISQAEERLEEEGISFQPSYGVGKDGKPITDEQRTEEYKISLEKIGARQQTAVENAGKHQEELNGILKERVIVQKGILRLETEEARNEQARKKESRVGEKEWKNDDKKEEQKAEKKLERERKQELKRLQQEQKRETDKAIKTFVEGFTINAGKSATPHQTSLVHKAIDGIRKDIERAAADGHIDPEELQNLNKLFVGKLTELGVASRQVLQGLKQMFESNIGAINKEITEIKRTQRMQLSRERLRR